MHLTPVLSCLWDIGGGVVGVADAADAANAADVADCRCCWDAGTVETAGSAVSVVTAGTAGRGRCRCGCGYRRCCLCGCFECARGRRGRGGCDGHAWLIYTEKHKMPNPVTENSAITFDTRTHATLRLMEFSIDIDMS